MKLKYLFLISIITYQLNAVILINKTNHELQIADKVDNYITIKPRTRMTLNKVYKDQNCNIKVKTQNDGSKIIFVATNNLEHHSTIIFTEDDFNIIISQDNKKIAQISKDDLAIELSIVRPKVQEEQPNQINIQAFLKKTLFPSAALGRIYHSLTSKDDLAIEQLYIVRQKVQDEQPNQINIQSFLKRMLFTSGLFKIIHHTLTAKNLSLELSAVRPKVQDKGQEQEKKSNQINLQSFLKRTALTSATLGIIYYSLKEYKKYRQKNLNNHNIEEEELEEEEIEV